MAKKEKLSLDEMLEKALVKDEDKPYEVPSNWVWTIFGSVCKLENGYAFSSDDYKETGVPLIRISNINGHTVEINGCVYIDRNDIDKKFLIYKGDLLIAMSGATTGKTGIYNYDFPAWQNQRVGNIKIIDTRILSPKYRNYFIISRQEEIFKKAYGGAQPNISGKMIEGLKIPLPPLIEQQRIADIIESTFEKLDRAEELVQNVLDSFEARKSSILRKAFNGELTAKWREENVKEDVDSIIANLYNYRVSSTKTPIERSKIESIYSYEENETHENLPNGWRYVSLDKLCESFQYGTSKKSDKEGKVAVIRMGNLQSGKIDWTDLVYSSDEEDIKKYILNKGDVLFNRTNSPELVGKTSIYEGEQPAIFAGYLIRIKNYECLDSYYLNYVLNSSYAKEYCMRIKSDGVNQSNINAQKLAKFEVPFCSPKEQKEIVRILDNLLEKEQKARELCDIIIKNIEQLKKSILARAFRGELNTNNPGEESALELLKEVIQERMES